MVQSAPHTPDAVSATVPTTQQLMTCLKKSVESYQDTTYKLTRLIRRLEMGALRVMIEAFEEAEDDEDEASEASEYSEISAPSEDSESVGSNDYEETEKEVVEPPRAISLGKYGYGISADRIHRHTALQKALDHGVSHNDICHHLRRLLAVWEKNSARMLPMKNSKTYVYRLRADLDFVEGNEDTYEFREEDLREVSLKPYGYQLRHRFDYLRQTCLRQAMEDDLHPEDIYRHLSALRVMWEGNLKRGVLNSPTYLNRLEADLDFMREYMV